MRRWLVLLMVALLPLRIWAGDAMAVQMAAAQPAPAGVQAGVEHPPDCPGRVAAADAAGPAPVDPGTGPEPACASCTLCQFCTTVALELPVALPSPLLSLQRVPGGSAAAFASAPAALRFKPPIS